MLTLHITYASGQIDALVFIRTLPNTMSIHIINILSRQLNDMKDRSRSKLIHPIVLTISVIKLVAAASSN